MPHATPGTTRSRGGPRSTRATDRGSSRHGEDEPAGQRHGQRGLPGDRRRAHRQGPRGPSARRHPASWHIHGRARCCRDGGWRRSHREERRDRPHQTQAPHPRSPDGRRREGTPVGDETPAGGPRGGTPPAGASRPGGARGPEMYGRSHETRSRLSRAPRYAMPRPRPSCACRLSPHGVARRRPRPGLPSCTVSRGRMCGTARRACSLSGRGGR